MIAITSGLNTPPIRRLKRTWEQVNQRYLAQFGACEMTIDSNKNFNKYRSLMASVTPPCVPFIGKLLDHTVRPMLTLLQVYSSRHYSLSRMEIPTTFLAVLSTSVKGRRPLKSSMISSDGRLSLSTSLPYLPFKRTSPSH